MKLLGLSLYNEFLKHSKYKDFDKRVYFTYMQACKRNETEHLDKRE